MGKLEVGWTDGLRLDLGQALRANGACMDLSLLCSNEVGLDLFVSGWACNRVIFLLKDS